MTELGSLIRLITVITRFGGCVQNEFEICLIKFDVKESARDFLFALANHKPRSTSAMLMNVRAMNVMSVIPFYSHHSDLKPLNLFKYLHVQKLQLCARFLNVFLPVGFNELTKQTGQVSIGQGSTRARLASSPRTF